MLSAEYEKNELWIVSAGEDNSVRVWDLRVVLIELTFFLITIGTWCTKTLFSGRKTPNHDSAPEPGRYPPSYLSHLRSISLAECLRDACTELI